MNSINVGLETTRTTIDTNTTVYASGNNKIRFDDPSSVIYFTGEIIVSYLCIFGNALVLEAIRRHRSLHTPTNVFIFNLAFSDLFVGLLVMPAQLIFRSEVVLITFTNCLFFNGVVFAVKYNTILMLLVVACERFIATRFPFFYCRNVDMDSAKYVSVVVWIASATFGMIPLMGWNLGQNKYREHHQCHCSFQTVFAPNYVALFQIVSMFFVPLLIITFVHTYIAFVVHKHRKLSIALHERFNIKEKRDFKTNKIVAAVVTSFICLFLPLNILKLVYYLENPMFCDYTGETLRPGKLCDFPRNLFWFAIWLGHLHSLVDPVIYAVGNSRLRLAMKNVLLNRSVPLPMNLFHGSYIRNIHSKRTTIFLASQATSILYDTEKLVESKTTQLPDDQTSINTLSGFTLQPTDNSPRSISPVSS